MLDGPIHADHEIARTSQLRQQIILATERLASLLYLTPESSRDAELIYRNSGQDGAGV